MFGQLAEMPCGDGNFEIFVRELNGKTVCLHRFDVFGPLVDDGCVETGMSQIGADTTADRAGTEDGYFFVGCGHVTDSESSR